MRSVSRFLIDFDGTPERREAASLELGTYAFDPERPDPSDEDWWASESNDEESNPIDWPAWADDWTWELGPDPQYAADDFMPSKMTASEADALARSILADVAAAEAEGGGR